MKKLLLCLGLALASFAYAGDKLIGTIIVTDAGTASNRTTGYTAYACPANINGGCFMLNSPQLLDVQCDQDCLVCTDLAGCDAGTGVHLAGGQLLPTSTSNIASTQTGRAYNSDGGTTGAPVVYFGAWISIAPWNTDGGGTTAYGRVFQRNGNE